MVAAALSLLLLVLFFIWFRPGLLMMLGYLAICALATLSVPILYRLAGFTQRDDARWIEEREEQEYLELSGRLKQAQQQLEALGIDDGVRQAQQLNGLVDDYHSVVETRFLGKKHMPLEYLGAARQVQKQAVQNLSDMVTVGHSLSTIDSNTYDEKHGGTDKQSRQNEMYREQQGRIKKLLDENHQMFDALTETAVEVANIDSFSKYERIDTLARLVSLSQIAGSSGK